MVSKTLPWVQGPAAAGGGATARKGASQLRETARACTTQVRRQPSPRPGTDAIEMSAHSAAHRPRRRWRAHCYACEEVLPAPLLFLLDVA
jgi:hypothetical protein